MSINIKSLSETELVELMKSLGIPGYRGKQIYEWIHTHNVSNYDDMTNLPKALRQQLAEAYPMSEMQIVDVRESKDGTKKYLFELADGELTEAVGMVYGRGETSFDEDDAEDGEKPSSGKRLTVCFSTQVGCPMACEFCATGHEGFKRNLTADEMVEQVALIGKDMGIRVSNVVAMGQGEPFMNYDALLEAIRRINTDKGLNIGARHITISTSGMTDGIHKIADESEQFRLALSLHSAVQETRNELMPKLEGQPLRKLRKALEYYNNVKGRRITIEYMLLDGVNDSVEDLNALLDFIFGLSVHINLLPYNTISGIDYEPSPQEVVSYWEDRLNNAGYQVSVRNSKGSDIAGACGQLKNTR